MFNDLEAPVTDHRSPPPPAESCLCRPYPSSQKGGTVIAEEVLDLDVHERLLGNGGYRPAGCPRCGKAMHIHEYRERVLVAHAAVSTEVALFRCSDRGRCGAVTRVLPAFLARHLWRAWPTVEDAVAGPEKDEELAERVPMSVPERTRRRWRARLVASAAVLVVALGTASATVAALHAVVQRVGLDGTRAELVAVLASAGTSEPMPGLRLATAATVVHRLVPGVRLM